jgi:ribokinase
VVSGLQNGGVGAGCPRFVVGSYTLDLFMSGARLPNPEESVNFPEYDEAHGGKAINQAVAAARMGVPVQVLTGVGDDDAGHAARRLLQDERIDAGLVQVSTTTSTARSFVLLDPSGRQQVATWLGASADLDQDAVLAAVRALMPGSVLLLQGELPMAITQAAANNAPNGVLVMLNPSPVEGFERFDYSRVDVLVLNRHEAMTLDSDDAQAVARRTGVQTVIVTRGGSGVEIFETSGRSVLLPPKVNAVDTTGAGDCFLGVLAAGLHERTPLLNSVERAMRAASLSTTRRYCVPSLPTLAELEAWAPPTVG